MPASTLRQKLAAHQTLLGLGINYPAPGIIEGMCKGWDVAWLDGQHGQFHYDAIANSLRASLLYNLETIVRVPGHDLSTLSLYADLAPSALMVPMVNTAEQAKPLPSAVHFAPKGSRSYGGRRPIDLFGRSFFETEIPVLIAQIETPQAADNARDIIAVDGIDMLFFGADDMKIALNIPIDTPTTDHPQLLDAMQKTADAARAANKFSGIVAPTPALAKRARDMGYQLLIGGGDAAFLRTAAADKLSALRGTLTTTNAPTSAY